MTFTNIKSALLINFWIRDRKKSEQFGIIIDNFREKAEEHYKKAIKQGVIFAQKNLSKRLFEPNGRLKEALTAYREQLKKEISME